MCAAAVRQHVAAVMEVIFLLVMLICKSDVLYFSTQNVKSLP